MENKDFTLYPEALELKQLGFTEPCLASYYHAGRRLDICEYINHGEYTVLAPTYSQAFRWFRKEHLLEGLVLPQDKSAPDPLPIYFIAVVSYENGIMSELFNSTVPGNMLHYFEHEEAELACLKKLIEIIKEQQ
jgi:hypothetical protein